MLISCNVLMPADPSELYFRECCHIFITNSTNFTMNRIQLNLGTRTHVSRLWLVILWPVNVIPVNHEVTTIHKLALPQRLLDLFSNELEFQNYSWKIPTINVEFWTFFIYCKHTVIMVYILNMWSTISYHWVRSAT